MGVVSVRVEGQEKVLKEIHRRMGVITDTGRNAVKETLFRIQAVAKNYVKVDLGRLRASISVNYTDGPGVGRVESYDLATGSGKNRKRIGKTKTASDGVGNPGGDKFTFFGVVGTNVEYALDKEFDPKRGRPYLRPAYEMEVPRLRRVLAGEILGSIERGTLSKASKR
jgi:hypothetical protein